jgi:hypothetical protein
MKRLGKLLMVTFALVLGAVGLAACGSDDDASEGTAVDVIMDDFSFEVSGDLTEGGGVRLVNEGDEVHMIGFGKLKDGATVDDVKDALENADPNAEEDPTAEFLEEGEIGWPGGFVTPGHEVTFSAANLEPGNYALICFFPTEGGGPPHFAQGMVHGLTVVAGDGEGAEADETYTVEAGKPIEGEDTLDAGVHTISIEGEDIGDLEPQLVRADSADQSADDITQLLQEQFSGFESEAGPAKGDGKKLAEYFIFSGFDLGDLDAVTFTFDFEPGTYYLAVGDSDTDGDETPKELIKITVE